MTEDPRPNTGHRVVLFSQFTSMLDILEDFLRTRDFRYCRLDGSTNRVQRAVDISSFNAKGSPYFLFLMSTRAGGLGVNLQSADTCILYDSDWNPQADVRARASPRGRTNRAQELGAR
jgi:SWI/SNF-related matrix-associated actin-dependent regulator of chromatin subfamily A member 5